MAISNRIIISTLVLQLLFFNMSFSQDSDGDFRSLTSGPWSSLSSWQEFNGSWGPATHAPDFLDEKITIRSSHTITVSSADFSIDQTTVANGGILTINAGRTIFAEDDFSGVSILVESGGTINVNGTLDLNNLIISDVEINGSLNNIGGLIDSPDPSYLYFGGSSALYLHNFTEGGIIPLATWDTGSTCRITGMDTSNAVPPANLNQDFYHFDWNCTAQKSTMNLNGVLASIGGNLIISGTNAKALYFINGGAGFALDIVGDFQISGSSTVILSRSISSTTTINVGGAISFTQGTPTTFGASNGDIVTINLNGNLTSSSQLTGAANTTGNINFIGGVVQSISYTGATINRTINFNVLNNGTLALGTSVLSGPGTFTLNSGSSARLGSLSATGAVGGNIATTGKVFNAGSTVIYAGSGAQFMGLSQPPTAGVITQISNAAGVTIVAGVNPTINGNLIIDSGARLNLGTQTLTLAGTISGAGAINANSTGSLTINGTGNFGTLNFFNNPGQLLNFTINRTSLGQITLGSDLRISGLFTQTAGDLDISSRVLYISGNYGRTAGNLITNGATVIGVDGTGTLPANIAIAGAALNTLALDRAGSTLTTNSSFQVVNEIWLVAGTLNNTAGAITMASGATVKRNIGTLSNSLNAVTSYNLIYDNASAISTGPEVPSGLIQLTGLNNFTKQNSGTLTVSAPLIINGDLNLSGPGFDPGAQSVNLKGNLVSNATSSLLGSIFTFSGNTTISGGTTPVFNVVNVDGILSPGTSFQINGNLAVNGTINSASGAVIFGGTTSIISQAAITVYDVVINVGATVGYDLSSPNKTLNVGNLWLNSGTFNAGSGGTGSTINFTGTTTIGGTSPAIFNNLTISGTLTAPATLTLNGNFTNNGTFNAGSGTVTFSGTSSQAISGSTNTTFNNITVTNIAQPNSVQVSSAQGLRGILTLSANSKFNAGNQLFTLLSSDDEPLVVDAAIAALPAGAAVTGNVIIQRYMSIEGGSNDPAYNNGRIYRYISSPVQNAPVSDLQLEIPVTGSFTGTSICSGCGSNQSMFIYNEAEIGDTNGSGGNDFNDGYEDFPLNNNSETFTAGKGYAFFVRGNIAPVSTAGNARYDLRGPINSGTVNFGVSYTTGGGAGAEGWNLVGNPYPATIDWDAPSGWTKTGLDNTIYMKDNGAALGTFATYVGGVGGTNGGTQYIPIGQAFWVVATSAPDFQATEAVKAPGNATTFFRTSLPSDILRVSLSSGLKRDEILVYFDPNASIEFDGSLDAYKLKNDIFNLSSLTQSGTKLAINSLPPLTCAETIKLDVSDVVEGSYHFDFTEMESFTANYQFRLVDHFLGITTDILADPSYTFDVTTDANSFGDTRFEITIAQAPVEDNKIIEGSNVCVGSSAEVIISNSQSGVEYYASLNGTIVSPLLPGSGSELILTIEENQLALGANNVIVYGQALGCNPVPMIQAASIEKEEVYQVTSTQGGTNCKGGSVTLTADGAPSSGAYNWYVSESDISPILGQSEATFSTPFLDKTSTYYVAAVNSLGCEGSRSAVIAEIINYDDVTIDMLDDTFISSYATGNQWFKDGVLIPAATNQSFKPEESGVYKVEVNIGSCTTSSERSFTVTGWDEEFLAGKLKVYPNPVEGELVVEINDLKLGSPKIMDLTGRVLGEIEMKTQGSKLVGKFDFRNQPGGVYILQVSDPTGKIYSKRISKR